jgi:hypothetical protein
MSGFKTDYIDVRIHRWTKNDSDTNELLNDLEYTHTDGTVYTVPKGFKTNFASVPKYFRNIIEPTGKHTNAAALHDFLYARGYKMNVSRKKADKIFYDAMRDSFVNIITANVLWFAVRVFGGFFYKKKD